MYEETESLRKAYGLSMIVAELKNNVIKMTTSMFNKFLEGYDDYLDLLYNETQNSISILRNIYLSCRINNEVYTFKETMQHPDRVFLNR